MIYAAIEFVGGNELKGVKCQIDYDFEKVSKLFEIEDDDSTYNVRKLYYFLLENGFKHNRRTGLVEGYAFGIANYEMLFGLECLHKYICFIGGLHNPNLFYATRSNIPFQKDSNRVDRIIELVRNHFLGENDNGNSGEAIDGRRQAP